MNEHQNSQSGTNTILIVLLIIIVLGAAIWLLMYFGGSQTEEPNNDNGVNVELNLPEGNAGGGTGGDESSE